MAYLLKYYTCKITISTISTKIKCIFSFSFCKNPDA